MNERKNLPNSYLQFALAVLTAALLVLAFPRANLAWLAPVALAPLLYAVAREPRPGRRFLLGYVAGVVYWFGVCYWIQFVLSFHGGLGDVAGWTVFMLFCLAKAFHLAFFGVLAGILMRRWWAIPGVAALWVAIEITHTFLGFAWLDLGNAGIDMSLPLRLAPIAGVYGISFVFAMMSAALALVALRRPRLQLGWLAALPLLVLLPPITPAPRGSDTAVLVQPNISETEEWTEASVDQMERGLVNLSLQAASAGGAERPSLIVWPEVPAPLYYDGDVRFQGYLDGLARATHAYVLAGVVGHTESGAPLNSAQLVSPDGQAVSRYDKIRLVPFGEFVPWPFGFAKKISTETGDFEAGDRVVVSPVGAHKIGTFICYESVFPNLVREFVNHGAQVLFNISNDGWFGHSAARRQHLEIVRMRAVENHRWILRSTNDGITATIDSAGRMRGELPGFVQAASRTGFRFDTTETFYTRHGDWFAIACAAVALVLLVLTKVT